MKFRQIFAEILQTEERMIPLFVHNAESQSIAAVFLVTESAAANLIAQLTAPKAPSTPAAPAA